MTKLEAAAFTIFILLLLGCSAAKNSTQVLTCKLPPQQLREDFSLLKKILEANHPGLYWYTPKDSINTYFSKGISSITDSLTEAQFKNKVAYVVGKIHCGHTSVRSSKAYSKAVQKNKSLQFPLGIKTWQDSVVVTGSAFRNDSTFKRGTIITSINGFSNKQLLDSMFQFISTDGYSDNFKSQLISFNFPAFYKNAFGTGKDYRITYIDSLGNLQAATIPAYDPNDDTLNKQNKLNLTRRPTHKEIRTLKKLNDRSLQIDTATSTAYMRLTEFGKGFRNFFRQSFARLHQQNIQHLIIDLRENGGGNMGISTVLARYLTSKPFKNADTVAAISRSFQYSRYIHPSLVYWFAMHTMSRRQPDGRYHFRYYEKHYFQPKKTDHFNGQIYFLQGGFTFSASCMLLNTLKGQPNVQLIGEETGGGSYGNTAVHLPAITLPHSHIRVVLPMYRVVFNHNRQKNGRGITPDVQVKSTSVSIKQGIDLKFDSTMQLIKQSIKR